MNRKRRAASRVFFTWPQSNLFNETLFEYDELCDARVRELLDETWFNFKNYRSLRVDTGPSIDLYTFKNNANPGEFTRYRLDSTAHRGSERFSVRQLAAPPTRRYGAGMASYDSKWIFITGGYGQNSVDLYDVRGDEWVGAPAMNEARFEHSCCTVGSVIFVFGGVLDQSGKTDGSDKVLSRQIRPSTCELEKLNAARVVSEP